MTDAHIVAAAGYIVTDNELIHGYGQTADAAWADMLNTMQQAGVVLPADDDDSSEQQGSWTRESALTIRPASAALLRDGQDMGGAIAFRRSPNGVYGTYAEVDA